MDTYVVMVVDDDHDSWETLAEKEKQTTYDADYRFGELLAERGGRIVGGQELDHPRQSTVLRSDGAGGVVRSDGPFAESVEQVGGFYIVESPTREALLEACALMVAAHTALEIRPVPVSED